MWKSGVIHVHDEIHKIRSLSSSVRNNNDTGKMSSRIPGRVISGINFGVPTVHFLDPEFGSVRGSAR